MDTSLNQPKSISAAEFGEVLERARDEGWTSVSLISPPASHEILQRLPPGHIYIIDTLPRAAVRLISGLTKLSALGLVGLEIGAEGARALASLSGLTSLRLERNQIGDEGARALASLSALTSLTLGSNQIGDEGARALLKAWSEKPIARNLRSLSLKNNGDLTSILPREALDTRDAQSILAGYRRYRSAAKQKTLRPLNEAKLLVVGTEAVGKTSLIRYLVENKPRNPSVVSRN